VTAAAILAIVSPASATAPNFCPQGSGAGQCNSPQSVAVDQSDGDVYVADGNNYRIDEFDSSGRFLRAFGYGVRDGARELQTCTTICVRGFASSGGEGGVGPVAGAIDPISVAVDSSTHDVYVSDANARIEKFAFNLLSEEFEFLFTFGKEVNETAVEENATRSAEENVCPALGHPADVCGAGALGSGPGDFNADGDTYTKLPVAVDPATHDVWVGDAERVQVFSEAGGYLSEVPLPGTGAVASLALNTDALSPGFGDLYVLDPPLNEVQHIEPPASGTYTLEFEGQSTGALPYDASNAEIQAALNGLSTIAGNVSVHNESEGKGERERERTVHFQDALSDRDVPSIVASAGSVPTLFQGGPGGLHRFAPNGLPIEALDVSGNPQAVSVDPTSGDVFVGGCQRLNGVGSSCTSPYGLLEYDALGAQTEAFASGEVTGGPYGNAIAFGGGAQRLYLVSGQAEGKSAAQSIALPEPGPSPEAGSSKAKSIRKTTASVCTTVNPEGASTTVHSQYIAEARFKEDGDSFGAGTSSTPESTSIGSDFQAHEACQALSSLIPGTTYRFRLVAANENGTVDGETASFSTLPAAAIDSTSVSSVTAGSATFEAEINPLGDATSYRFEYLSETTVQQNEQAGHSPFAGAETAPAPVEAIGAGEADVAVSQHVQGLQPDTTYRYRVVVINAVTEAHGGPFAGPTQGFATQSPALFGLPDHRGWELVSPPEKHGAAFEPAGQQGPLQASADGDAITYLATAPTEAEPPGNPLRTQVLSGRGSDGWASRDISGPHSVLLPLVLGYGFDYRLFSSDLSVGVYQPFGVFEPSLSPQASESTTFLHSDFSPGDASSFCTSSCYRPLVTGCPKIGACPPSVEEAADVPAGTVFGASNDGGDCQRGAACGPFFTGATSDLANVVVESKVALTEAPAVAGGLYEWSGGLSPVEALRLVSVLPGGGAAGGPALGFNNEDARNAISKDGSRVVWGAGGHLYVRLNATAQQSPVTGSQVDGSQCTDPAGACTVQADALQGGPGGSQTAVSQFQSASVDGSRVFFTDTQQLTADAGTSAKGGDLYEYDLDRPAGQSLLDLTPAKGGESAAVQGSVVGASEDGSYLYFVADSVLAPGAAPGDCSGVGGERRETCDLYMRHDGVTSLVATLTGEDSPDWAKGHADLSQLSARVSPDGRWLAFMSSSPLTGYDNRDAVSGRPDEEVFLYHAGASEAGAGRLACASCDPTGARPNGVEYETGTFSIIRIAGGGVSWKQTWIAASVPGWTAYMLGAARYQSRYLSDSGRLFFNSSDALVPQDTTGTEDVYQYEPSSAAEGAPVGDTCTEAGATYSRVSDGCVNLISSGASPEESGFLDASETGGDVFFLTNAKLSYLDFDSAPDVYDARVGGGDVEPARPIECAGDACQQPANVPMALTPASLTFSGPGTPAPVATPSLKPKAKPLTRAEKLARALRTCRAKRGKRKRAVCEKQARRAYGSTAKAKGSHKTITLTPRKRGK
jgi:hypothetical protein